MEQLHHICSHDLCNFAHYHGLLGMKCRGASQYVITCLREFFELYFFSLAMFVIPAVQNLAVLRDHFCGIWEDYSRQADTFLYHLSFQLSGSLSRDWRAQAWGRKVRTKH